MRLTLDARTFAYIDPGKRGNSDMRPHCGSSYRWSIAIAALVCCGCGGERLYPVEGRVTIEGSPLATGSVVLFPDDGRAQPSDRIPQAKLNPSGEYRIVTAGQPGAPAGKYRVAIVAQTDVRPMNLPANPMNVYPLIDQKYFTSANTTLRIEVGPNPAIAAYDLAVTR